MTAPSQRFAATIAAGISIAALATSLSAQAPPAAPAGRETFAETIDVVETSALVELPAGRDDARPTDLLLLEAGLPRQVIRVEPLRDEAWEIVLWVDGPLCEPAALESTLVALAQQAEALTRLGSVRVVVAAPRPEAAVAATREPLLLAERLVALARENPCTGQVSRLLWDARGAGTAAAGERALVALRDLVDERHDQLVAGVPACTGACALLLVAHGYPPHADLSLPPAMRPPDSPRLAGAIAAATADIGRRLAVARWAVVALPFAPPRPAGNEDEVPPGAAPGPDAAPPSVLEADYPVFRLWPPRGRSPAREMPAASWDVYTVPELASLRELADTTAGLVLRAPEQLPAALDALASRVRVWYRTTPFAPGEERPLEVLVGEPLRLAGAPAWVGAPRPAAAATSPPAQP
jgi:hypothetical protein